MPIIRSYDSTMATSFADYCATADTRAAIAANVEEWCQMLCLALELNFIDQAIRRQVHRWYR